MEKQQASVSNVEHEIDVEMGHNMEMATDGNIEVRDRKGIDVSRSMVFEEQFGKGKRVKQPSIWLKDRNTYHSSKPFSEFIVPIKILRYTLSFSTLCEL